MRFEWKKNKDGTGSVTDLRYQHSWDFSSWQEAKEQSDVLNKDYEQAAQGVKATQAQGES